MLKHFASLLVLLSFSLTTISAPYAKSQSLNAVLLKYDYLLTTHPQAHEETFQEQTMTNFKLELESVVITSSREELEQGFQTILMEIPTQEKRDVYLKVLRNSSRQEIIQFLANPKLLADSLQGESANFFVRGEPVVNAMIFLFAGLILTAIIDSIIQNAKYEFYDSYEMSRGCSALYDHEEIAMKENVLNKCLANARYPETCRNTGFSNGTGYNTISGYDREGYWEHTESYPTCVATAKADKKID